MRLNKWAIALIWLCSTFNVLSQDYFIVGQDTTFCKNLGYTTTIQGYLKSMNYINTKGDTVSIQGVKNVPNVLTFYVKGSFFDKTPLKANKPKSYIRYTLRVADGKLKVYKGEQGYIQGSGVYYSGSGNITQSNSNWNTSGATGSYRFFIKMPDGTFYKINSKKNMKKYIKPYLLQCQEFKEQYKGNFDSYEQSFISTINLYNSLCE